MATKHFCDRCGKEIEDCREMRVIVGHQAGKGFIPDFHRTCEADLCDNCREWLVREWPFVMPKEATANA